MIRIYWREVLLGMVSRLRFVYRFSTCRTSRRESIAEHSYYTALYVMFICDWLGDPQLMAEALPKALMHDMEEARTGDIPRPFKYLSRELKENLDAAGLIAYNEVMGGVTHDKDYLKIITYRWLESKTGMSGRVVAFADYMSCLSHVAQELEAHNFAMLEHTKGIKEYGETFLADQYEFIHPLVREVLALAEEVLDVDDSA